MHNFNTIKDLYEDGYRCIYHDCVDSTYKVYLKNFDTEDSQVIELNNDSDFSQFQGYINQLRMT